MRIDERKVNGRVLLDALDQETDHSTGHRCYYLSVKYDYVSNFI